MAGEQGVHLFGARTSKSASRRSSRSGALHVGVVTLLVGLVLIPLSVLGVRTYEVLVETDAERSSVQQIVPVTERRILAISLGAALSDERTWSIALLGVERFGVDPDLVRRVLGIDIAAEYERSLGVTDDLTGGLPGIQERIEAVRSDRSSMDELAAGYRAAVTDVLSMGEAAATTLEQLAVGRPGGDVLLRQLALTEATAEAQLAVDSQFISFIGSQFDQLTGSPEADLQNLIESRRQYERAIKDIGDLVPPGPLEHRFRSVRSSSAQRALVVAVRNASVTATPARSARSARARCTSPASHSPRPPRTSSSSDGRPRPSRRASCAMRCSTAPHRDGSGRR